MFRKAPHEILDRAREALMLLKLFFPTRVGKKVRQTIPVIASLTSYPPRIGWVWISVETIMRQTVIPEKLILVLNEEEFPSRKLPFSLRTRQKRGLEVLWVERNGRSHDKLLPARAAYPTKAIVTLDDDKFFPETLLEMLFNAHLEYPGFVVSSRGWVMRCSKNSGQLRFAEGWTRAEPGDMGLDLFSPGGNGCLYPPNSLHQEVDNLEAALRVCPSADDIWFWGAIQKVQTQTYCLGLPPHRPIRVLRNGPALSKIGEAQSQVQFDAALDYYAIRQQVLSRIQNH